MGVLVFPCPACGKSCRVPAEAAGRLGKCPACGKVIQVPLPATPIAPPQPMAAAPPQHPPPPPPPRPIAATPLVDEALLAKVRAATREWKDRLADRTRRNRLLYFRPTLRTTLRILPPIEGLFDRLLDGGRVPLEQLATDPAGEAAVLTMKTLRSRSREFEEERGVNPLFAVFGFLEWKTSLQPDVECLTPVILVPVRIEAGGRRSFVLEGTDETYRLNPLLEQQLREDVGATIELPEIEDEEETTPDPGAPPKPPLPPALTRLLDAVDARLPRERGWKIRREACLGLLAYQKMVIVKDIEEREREIASHPLLAALVGDLRAWRSRQAEVPEVRLEHLDRIPPDKLFQVLDADSSQQQCVEMAKAGTSFVIQGPPGTGKSQTIANVIAELIGAGKRVLFVSEKRAALEVVFHRLRSRGLEHLCLDLHAVRADRRQVSARFQETLERIRAAAPNDGKETFRRLEEERRALSGYAAALARKRPPLGSSLYEMYGRVLAGDGVPDLRFRVADAAAWVPERIERAERGLERLHTLRARLAEAQGSPFLRTPWGEDRPPEKMRETLGGMRDAIDDAGSSDARAVLGLAPDATIEGLDITIAILDHVANGPDLPPEWIGADPAALATEAEGLAKRVEAQRADERKLSDRYEPGVLEIDLDGLDPRFREWASSWLRRVFLPLSGAYRAARRTVLAHAKPGVRTTSLQLSADVAFARKVRDGRRALTGAEAAGSFRRWYKDPSSPLEPIGKAVEWRRRISSLLGGAAIPDPIAAAATARADRAPIRERAARLHDLRGRIAAGEALLAKVLPADALATKGPLAGLSAIAARADAESGILSDVLDERTTSRELGGLGLRDLIAELDRLHVPGAQWAACLRRAVDRTMIEGAIATEPELRGFEPQVHGKRIRDFRREDVEQLDLAVLRLRRAHAERSTAAMNAEPEQERTLKAQIHRKRGGMHVRQLLSAAPDVLLALRPCWMMSPLSVTQFVDLGASRFDCVVFDEASQLLPEDVVPALLRAPQAIVAGDSRQLPPTPFFRHVGEEGDEETAVAGYESILDQVSTFLPATWLSWHYRSRDEGLIAFSNHYIYERRLVTFPDPRVEEDYGVQHVLVTDAVYTSGSGRGNPRETDEVVRLMLDHARRRPDESLGVIALGIQHQRAIQDRLEAALEDEKNADVAAFFAEQTDEPVFVKNLESVQGDERDAILLSVGYGPNAGGRVALHFGPLSAQGGERRWNVAVTRARKRLTLVTSFTASAIAPDRSSAKGIQLLRDYIEYAASRGRILGGASFDSRNPPENSFEMDVYEELVRANHSPACQVGCSSYRIDLAVPYPDKPGLFAIGIECDGASYHSSPTARDRDRLRQEILEQLGWRLHRVWSTAWFRDKARERERLLAAVAEALKEQPIEAYTAPAAQAPAEPATRPASGGTRLFTEKGPPLKGRTIDDYSIADLVQVVRWVGRDGKLRTDTELEDEVFRHLQFKRRGPRIVAQIRRAVEWSKSP